MCEEVSFSQKTEDFVKSIYLFNNVTALTSRKASDLHLFIVPPLVTFTEPASSIQKP